MITANMATFPPRSESLHEVVTQILPQVDRLNVVFNEYNKIPSKYNNIPKLSPIIPHEDTKDAGKFYPESAESDYILFIDDDVDYPNNYVVETIKSFECLPNGKFLGGYHTSVYQKPKPELSLTKIRQYLRFILFPHKLAAFREVISFNHTLVAPVFVDQVATNSAIIRGRDMPPYIYMRDSQKFVDVRLARWCFEKGIIPIALPRKANWLKTEPDEYSIFRTFTQKHPSHVAEEIRQFAFKHDYVGQSLLNIPDIFYRDSSSGSQ